MTKKISTKNLAFAILMGSIGLVMQATIPGIPLGVGGAKLELADIPVVLGASITGPVGGMICGFLYGVTSPAFWALVPSMMCILTLLGYLTRNRSDSFSISLAIIASRVIIGPLLSGILFNWLVFTSAALIDVWILCLVYALPGAILSIAIYTLIQNKIPKLFSTVNDKKS